MIAFYFLFTLPLIFILLEALIPYEKKNLISILTTTLSSLLFILLIILYLFHADQTITLIQSGPISLSFKADLFAVITSVFASILWIFSSIYSIAYFKNEDATKIKRYNIFSILNLYTILLIFLASNMITFFIFFEILLIASYVL